MLGKKFAFRLPNDTERYIGCGMTGTGKSQAALWQLSERSYDLMPWVILDFKRDELIAQIPYTQPINYDASLDKPGLYILRPGPLDVDEGHVDRFFLRLLDMENCGIFIDEGYMMKNSSGLNAVLTQGRSKRLPIIFLTQRPKLISIFAFTEAQYIQVFYLQFEQDRGRVQEYFPSDVDVEVVKDLPEHESLWYDAKQREVVQLKPVPSLDTILRRFDERLKPPEAPVIIPTETASERFRRI